MRGANCSLADDEFWRFSIFKWVNDFAGIYCVEDIPLCAKYLIENVQATSARERVLVCRFYFLSFFQQPNEMLIRFGCVWFRFWAPEYFDLNARIFANPSRCERLNRDKSHLGDVLWSSQSYHNAHISYNLSYDGVCNAFAAANNDMSAAPENDAGPFGWNMILVCIAQF